MAYDFDRHVERRGTDSLKWQRYAERDVLPLWVADMDFPAPPAVRDALRRRLEHGVFGYTLPPPELADVTVRMLRDQFSWTTQPEWFVWLPGVVSGISVACRAIGEVGDDVLTLVPIYRPFLAAPENMRRGLVTVPLTDQGGRWQIDFDRFRAAITPRSRLLLLCSPHNPVGRVWTREELTQLVEICLRHNITICSDEIHHQLVLDRGRVHTCTAMLGPEVAARTITLIAASKTFNLAGLGCSLAVIPDQRLRTSFQRAAASIVPYVNLFGYTATLAAYRDGWQWHAELLTYLRQNHELVIAAVARMPGLSTTPVEATYLAWIDTRPSGIEDPAQFFEQAGVGLSDGRTFGGPGYVRLNFGCPRSILVAALKRMHAALSR